MAVGWQQQEINTSWRFYHSRAYRFTASVVASWDQNFSRSALSVLTCDPHSAATSALRVSLVFLDFLFPSDGLGRLQVWKIYISLPRWSELLAADLPRRQMIGCLLKITRSDSARWQVLFPTKCTKIHLPWGCDPVKVRALFFQMCLPGPERELGLGILSCRPCLLSSCLGSDASPVYPCEAQQTPPISPSRTETTGAFQQLDLMWFHHWWG